MLDRGASAKNWEPRTSKTSTVFSYAILLGGVITIGVAVYMVMVSYSILPFWDGWMQIGVVARGENPLSVAWLWKQYDVHRVVIPKLFLLVDLRWFRATQVFLLVCNLLIQFLHLLLWAGACGCSAAGGERCGARASAWWHSACFVAHNG